MKLKPNYLLVTNDVNVSLWRRRGIHVDGVTSRLTCSSCFREQCVSVSDGTRSRDSIITIIVIILLS